MEPLKSDQSYSSTEQPNKKPKHNPSHEAKLVYKIDSTVHELLKYSHMTTSNNNNNFLKKSAVLTDVEDKLKEVQVLINFHKNCDEKLKQELETLSFQSILSSLQLQKDPEKSKAFQASLFKDFEKLKAFLLTGIIPPDIYLHLLITAYQIQNHNAFKEILSSIPSSFHPLISEIKVRPVWQSIFNLEKWADCKIKIECQNETLEVFVMRSVLLNSCAASIFNDLNIPQNDSIHLDWKPFAMSSQTALAILQFLYFGKINLNEEASAKSCFMLANKYKMGPLIQVFEDWILHYRGINKDNFSEFYELENSFCKQAVLSFVANYVFMHPNDLIIKKFYDSNLLNVKKIKITSLDPNFSNFDLNKIITFINDLKNLKELVIAGYTNFTHYHLRELALPDLEHIEVDFIPNFIELKRSIFKKCPKLTKVKLHYKDKGSFNLNKFLSGLDNLKHIEISYENFTNPKNEIFGPTYFQNQTSLERLEILANEKIETPNIFNNKLKQLTLNSPLKKAQIASISNVESLYVQWEDELWFNLDLLPKLVSLTIDASCQELNEKMADCLIKLPELKRLFICNDNVDDKSAQKIAHILKLEELLFLSSKSILKWLEAFIQQKKDNLEQMQVLKISVGINETKKIIHLLKKIKNLKVLHLYFHKQFPNDEYLKDLSELSSLEDLQLFVLPLSLKKTIKKVLRLDREINLTNFYVPYPDLLHIHQKIPFLKKLVTQSYEFENGCWTVRSIGEEGDLSYIKRIANLKLVLPDQQSHKKFISTITNEALSHLKELDFKGNPEDLKEILLKTPQLQILRVGHMKIDALRINTLSQLLQLESLTLNSLDQKSLFEFAALNNLLFLTLLTKPHPSWITFLNKQKPELKIFLELK
jgi:hypothetical protein